jgi:uncharacterized protein YdeI (YjbR/CyaY-like superfamily)
LTPAHSLNSKPARGQNSKPARSHNPKVDAYIQKAQPFAQPILHHIRKIVHSACPDVEETVKWSRPFFEYKGVILCNMSAFKQHCAFGFWGLEIGAILREAGAVRKGAMGTLGRITSVSTLPPEKQLMAWVRQAADFVDDGNYTSPIAARNKVVKAPKPTLKTPPEFTKALNKNMKARSAFAAFSPSCKREYIEWIVDAKREETRDQRIATAIDWIAEGKQRNWKYQK